MSHDEFHHSTHLLRQHEWKQNADQYWQHPLDFGPVSGTPLPSVDQLGEAIFGSEKSSQRAIIIFKTSATLVRYLFPSDCYSFKTRDTVALASFRLHTVKKLPDPSKGDQHVLGLYIHNVIYKKSDGSTVEGTYVPVLFKDFEDSTSFEPATMPEMYSNIKISDQNSRILVETGLCGAIWGRMKWNSLVERAEDYNEVSEDETLLLHKFVRSDNSQDQNAKPDAGYATYLEHGSKSHTESVGRGRISTGNSSFHFDAYDWNRLSTLHHVVGRLAELPIFEVVEASVVDNVGVPDFNDAKRVD